MGERGEEDAVDAGEGSADADDASEDVDAGLAPRAMGDDTVEDGGVKDGTDTVGDGAEEDATLMAEEREGGGG